MGLLARYVVLFALCLLFVFTALCIDTHKHRTHISFDQSQSSISLMETLTELLGVRVNVPFWFSLCAQYIAILKKMKDGRILPEGYLVEKSKQ